VIQHLLITYAYKRHGTGTWDFVNAGHIGTATSWLKDMQQYKDGEYRLLSAIPVSEHDFKWISDNT
jgi:hypothetical protein